MNRVRHRFALLFHREDGSFVSQRAVEPDWEPVFEAGRFLAVRRGHLGPADLVDAEIVPRWDSQHGPPLISAVGVELDLSGVRWACELPITCFLETARDHASALVASGMLVEGETYRYVPAAFALGDIGSVPLAGTAMNELPPLLPTYPVVLEQRLRDATLVGSGDADDHPVLIAASLLEEISVLTRGAGENETGGILLGVLLRDSASPELAVEITAQIPARAAEGSRSRLRFSAETWDDVARAIALRQRDEVWIGTWHSHPARAWCGGCPPERRPGCPMQRGFFSEHDRLLHRMFPRAYSVALVATDAEAGVRHALFGWRGGLIQPRAFHLIGAGPNTPLTDSDIATITRGPDGCQYDIAG